MNFALPANELPASRIAAIAVLSSAALLGCLAIAAPPIVYLTMFAAALCHAIGCRTGPDRPAALTSSIPPATPEWRRIEAEALHHRSCF